jgi:hypothetical protein
VLGECAAELARLDKAPIAVEAVERIDALFAIEREINGLTPSQRLAVRNGRIRPLVVALESWLRERRAKLSGQSKISKAIAYSLNWPSGRNTFSGVEGRARQGGRIFHQGATNGRLLARVDGLGGRQNPKVGKTKPRAARPETYLME